MDTTTQIEQEVTDFNQRHPKAVSEEKTNGTSIKEPVGEPHAESSPTISQVPSSTVVDTTNSPVPLQAQAPSDQLTAQEEHNGEVVVENDEDTVIY